MLYVSSSMTNSVSEQVLTLKQKFKIKSKNLLNVLFNLKKIENPQGWGKQSKKKLKKKFRALRKD